MQRKWLNSLEFVIWWKVKRLIKPVEKKNYVKLIEKKKQNIYVQLLSE